MNTRSRDVDSNVNICSAYLDFGPHVQSSFFLRSGNNVIKDEGGQKGNDHGTAENGQSHRRRIRITKRISLDRVEVTTGPGHGQAVEKGKPDDELVARAVEVDVLQVGQTDGDNQTKEGTVDSRCHGAGHGGEERSDLGNEGDADHDHCSHLNDSAGTHARHSQGANVFTVGSRPVGRTHQTRKQDTEAFASETTRDDSRRRRRRTGQVRTTITAKRKDIFDEKRQSSMASKNHTKNHSNGTY